MCSVKYCLRVVPTITEWINIRVYVMYYNDVDKIEDNTPPSFIIFYYSKTYRVYVKCFILYGVR